MRAVPVKLPPADLLRETTKALMVEERVERWLGLLVYLRTF